MLFFLFDFENLFICGNLFLFENRFVFEKGRKTFSSHANIAGSR